MPGWAHRNSHNTSPTNRPRGGSMCLRPATRVVCGGWTGGPRWQDLGGSMNRLGAGLPLVLLSWLGSALGPPLGQTNRKFDRHGTLDDESGVVIKGLRLSILSLARSGRQLKGTFQLKFVRINSDYPGRANWGVLHP